MLSSLYKIVQAYSLMKQAKDSDYFRTDSPEESFVLNCAGGGSAPEGKPGCLVLSPLLASQEAMAIEAACIAMKQALDLQSIQVS